MGVKCKFGYEVCDYQEYLEMYGDSNKSKKKLTHREYHEYEEELLDLITWQNIRKLTSEENERLCYLESLLNP